MTRIEERPMPYPRYPRSRMSNPRILVPKFESSFPSALGNACFASEAALREARPVGADQARWQRQSNCRDRCVPKCNLGTRNICFELRISNFRSFRRFGDSVLVSNFVLRISSFPVTALVRGRRSQPRRVRWCYSLRPGARCRDQAAASRQWPLRAGWWAPVRHR